MSEQSKADGLVEWLAPGEGEVIALLDFAFTTDGALAAALGPDTVECPVVRLDPVNTLLEAPACPSLAELADRYARALIEAGTVPAVLAAYCGAGRLGVLLSEQLLRLTGTAPRTVLVQPCWVDDRLIAIDVADAHGRLAGYAGPVPVAGPLELAAVLAVLQTALAGRLSKAGVPEEEIAITCELLLQRYRAFFGFLFATRDAARSNEPPAGVPQCELPQLRSLVLGWLGKRSPEPRNAVGGRRG